MMKLIPILIRGIRDDTVEPVWHALPGIDERELWYHKAKHVPLNLWPSQVTRGLVMKVDVVFQKSYVERPVLRDCFMKSIEVKLPEGFDQAHIIATRCYQPDNEVATIGGDINGRVLSRSDVDHIVGKLLTHIDATFTDQEQRKAQKDVVKDIVYTASKNLFSEAVRIVDAQHRLEAGRNAETEKQKVIA